MKKGIRYTTIIILFIGFSSCAQNIRQITINLSPVVIKNGKYFYDGQRVNFEDLKLLLLSVDDDKINHQLKVLKTTKAIQGVLIAVPLILFLANQSKNQGGTSQTSEYLLWGTVGFVAISGITLSIMKKGIINRYNDIVLQPAARISPYGISAGFSIRF